MVWRHLLRSRCVAFGPNAPARRPSARPSRHGNGLQQAGHQVPGRPCDAYEVHIGSYNIPTSNDGWDSGIVMLNSGPNEIMASVRHSEHAGELLRLRQASQHQRLGPLDRVRQLVLYGRSIDQRSILVGGGGLEWQRYHVLQPGPKRVSAHLAERLHHQLLPSWTQPGPGSAVRWTVIRRPRGTSPSVGLLQQRRHEYLIEYSGWAQPERCGCCGWTPATAQPDRQSQLGCTPLATYCRTGRRIRRQTTPTL